MSYSQSLVTSKSLPLSAIAVLLFAACGGGVKDNEKLGKIDKSQAQTLCEDLKSAGACSYKSGGKKVKIEVPSDCKSYSKRLTSADKETCNEVTVGETRDCHNACSENKKACEAYKSCLATSSSDAKSSDGSKSSK